MESAQRELVSVLLARLQEAGLISKTTYSKAVDLVHSSIDLPMLFQYSVCLTKEVGAIECAQDTK